MNWYSVTSYCSTEEAEHHYDHVVPALTQVHAVTKHLHHLVSMGLSEQLESLHIHSAPEFAGIEEKFCRMVDGRLVEV